MAHLHTYIHMHTQICTFYTHLNMHKNTYVYIQYMRTYIYSNLCKMFPHKYKYLCINTVAVRTHTHTQSEAVRVVEL